MLMFVTSAVHGRVMALRTTLFDRSSQPKKLARAFKILRVITN